MMTATQADKHEHAKCAARASFEEIKARLSMLSHVARGDDEAAIEAAEQAVHELPLSLLVRDGWRQLGADAGAPEEFELLLATGGPAVRIWGELDEYAQPKEDRCFLQWQDWFTPWEDLGLDTLEREVVRQFAQQFHFGE